MGSIAAIVASEPQDGHVQWQHSNVRTLRSPQGKELLVRVRAVGICHTDIFCSSVPEGMLGITYPKVLGHEGAGEVEAVGHRSCSQQCQGHRHPCDCGHRSCRRRGNHGSEDRRVCKAIIAVDLIQSRLNLAQELGATHVYNSKSTSDFVTDIQGLVNNQRISYVIDTTGVPSVMESLLLCLGKRGKLIQIGVPNPTATITLPLGDFFLLFQNKVFEVNYLGDARAKEILPKMIQWHKEGKFPVDKIVKLYPAKDVLLALKQMKGDVIKPILEF